MTERGVAAAAEHWISSCSGAGAGNAELFRRCSGGESEDPCDTA